MYELEEKVKSGLIQSLNKYFKKELPRLRDTYSWIIPKLEGVHYAGLCDYESNVKLKKLFHMQWLKANASERLVLAKRVVADWGGVKGNHPETMARYVDEVHEENPKTPLKGVASYSKIFSIVNLDKYAIYDARVAVCLNAIQWNLSSKYLVAFNYISGRNNITGNTVKRSGFAYDQRFKVKSLHANGWHSLKRDDTYQFYLNTLYECLKSFPKYKLYDLEMVLFSNAEKECLKAMQSSPQKVP